jgi:dipeptidyl aminopeptidase/acylaminoacyl peptidase
MLIRFAVIALALTIFSSGSFADMQRLQVELADGSQVATYLILPDAQAATQHPLMILMPPGSGEAALAFDLQSWLGQEMAERGWAVAVPVSPNQKSFRGTNNAVILQLIDELQKNPRIKGGKVLLAGVSNGGVSAIEIASMAPERVMAVLGVPAVISDRTKLSALEGMAIYLRIGDQDEYMWMNRYPETRDALLAAGAFLDADLVFMSPHMFSMDWENLDPFLAAVKLANDL